MTSVKLKTAILCAFTCTLTGGVIKAQSTDTIESKWQKYISLSSYSEPFWKTDTIFDETTLPIKENGMPSIKLLFKPSAVLSVKLANYSEEFIKGKDWDFVDGQLLILSQSTMPFLTKDDLVFNTYKPDFSMTGKASGTYVLFTEKPFFSQVQLAVT